MSNWLSEYSGEDQRQVDAVNQKGLAHAPTKNKEVGLFDGAGLAIPKGVVAGTIKVIDTVAKPFERIKDHIEYTIDDTLNGGLDGPLNVREKSFTDVHDQKNKKRQEMLVSEIEHLEDKENTGTVGTVAFGLGDYLTRAIIGGAVGGIPGAVAVTGTSETNYSYDHLTHNGVDSDTALQVAALDGVIAGGATALPLSYGFKGARGIAKDAALSIGGATAITTGGQYASGKILESNGYEQQSKKYEITPESLATTVILNGLMFGAGRYAGSRKANADHADVTVEQIQANQNAVEATLMANELQFDVASSPVRTADPIQHNNHLRNLDSAVESLRTGRPVTAPHSVKGENKQNTINYESMALPTNAKSIARRAQQEGVNPSVALTISHIETGGSFSHTAQNPTSTAHGLFQVLDRTWKGQGGRDRNNVDEQIRMGLMHIKNANASMRKSLGREPVAHEQYLGHLLGPGGASKVLKADPNAKLIDVVRKYDAKNADAIVNNNGMSGLTVGQAVGKWRTKWNGLSKRYGENGTSTAYGMDGTSYEMAYEIRSLDELIASNDSAYGVNPKYPSELQPRDRTREASRQQIERMAEDLRPELLGESHKLSDGAPIIGMDNVVESGNGRTLAIGKAYENGRAEEYRNYIDQYAQEKGWDISGINNPVLVRTRLTDTDRVQFTKLANESDVAQLSAPERAISDVDRLPDASLLNINNDGSINLDGSMDFVRGFVGQLPKAEQATAMTGEGRLSQEGKRRIESALVQHAYGDSSLVARLSENLGDEGKTILNALLKSAPKLAQLSALVKQGGRHENTIAKDLAQAAQKMSDLKASGVHVDDYLNQGQLIDDGLSPGAKEFLNVFETNNRSAKAIGDHIQSKLDEVEAMGDPRQGSLFADTPEVMTAMRVLNEMPEMQISVSRDIGGGQIEITTMSAKDRMAEIEAEMKQATETGTAAQAAISCFLQFGA